MAQIDPNNLRWYLSGGAANADPNASIGGGRSSTLIAGGLDNLFDDVLASEAAAGETVYRCAYFRNEDANVNGLMAPLAAWLSATSLEANDAVAIAVCTAKGDAAAVADEFTAPAGGTLVGGAFSAPTTKATGIACPAPLLQNEYIAVWMRRVITAGAASSTSESASVSVEGDSA